jgi:septum formation protein
MDHFSQLQLKDIILGSASPRRQLLLEKLDIPFRVLTRKISEDYPGDLIREQIPLYLCQKKAAAYKDELDHPDTILITADTIVWMDDHVLDKPAGREEAFNTLNALSGRKHQVITGVCLSSRNKRKTFFVSTDVYFKSLKKEEINYYIEHYRPFDKAGAYGIQEWIGYVGIERIEGSFYNVMGLPVKALYDELLIFL